MQQILESKEDVRPEQQEWNQSLDQKHPDPLDIKEEQEELWIAHEEKPQSSQLLQSQRDENTEVELLVSNSTEGRTPKKRATGDNCGGSEPANDSSLFSCLRPHTDYMQQVLESKEDRLPEQRKWNQSLDQKDSDPLDLKEEQEELWREDEEKPQSSRLLQIPSDENTEGELLVSNSTEHRTLKKEATGDDCGGSEPVDNSSLFSRSQPEVDDVQRFLQMKEEAILEQQQWNLTVNRCKFKEEEEKLCVSHQGQDPDKLEDADVSEFSVTVVPVKTENVHQTTEPEAVARSSTLRGTLTAQPDGWNNRGSQPARNSGPYSLLQPDVSCINSDSSETETDDSCEWKQGTREPHSGLNCQTNSVSVSHSRCSASKKQFVFSEGGYRNPSKQTTDMDASENVFSRLKYSQKFEQNSHLSTRGRIHTTEKQFECSECGQRYGHKRNLVRHMRIHSNSGSNIHLQLDPNNRNAFSQETETDHDWKHTRNICLDFTCLKNANNVSPSNCQIAEQQCNCSKYGNACVHMNNLEQHKGKQASINPTSSLDRENGLRQKNSMNTHMRIHTGEKPFGCSECPKRFGQKGEWTRHMKIHTGQKLFGCSECNQRFRQKSERTRHMIIHTEQKPFGCSECTQTFRRKSHLNTHMIIHTGQKPFGCTQCGQRFGQKSNLNTHMITHTRQKPFDCNECGQRFGRKSSLKTHMIIHSGQKPFVCSECGQRFGLKGSLKTHMMIHSGQKPFDCPECGQRFGQKGHLQTHMITHTGQKPFGCYECGQRFGQKSHLNRHVIIHSGQKPFVCSECRQRFGQKIQLKRHLINHRRQVSIHTHAVTVLD